MRLDTSTPDARERSAGGRLRPAVDLKAALRVHVAEVVLMAAIVTGLLCVPAGAVLAGVLFLLDIPLLGFVTFGGALNGFQAALTWWIFGFLPALGYAAYLLRLEPNRVVKSSDVPR